MQATGTSGAVMAKALTIFGMVVAGLLTLVFTLDLLLGIPFDGAQLMMDIGGMLSGMILGYVSFSTFRELK